MVAHPLMAETCIDYLLHFAHLTHPLNVDTFPDYPLASYAAEYWGYHLVLCHGSARLFDSAMHLMKGGSRQYLALNRVYTIGGTYIHSEPRHIQHICGTLSECAAHGQNGGTFRFGNVPGLAPCWHQSFGRLMF
jgi:hypothetical protein